MFADPGAKDHALGAGSDLDALQMQGERHVGVAVARAAVSWQSPPPQLVAVVGAQHHRSASGALGVRNSLRVRTYSPVFVLLREFSDLCQDRLVQKRFAPLADVAFQRVQCMPANPWDRIIEETQYGRDRASIGMCI